MTNNIQNNTESSKSSTKGFRPTDDMKNMMIQMIQDGKSNAEIHKATGIGFNTIIKHKHKINGTAPNSNTEVDVEQLLNNALNAIDKRMDWLAGEIQKIEQYKIEYKKLELRMHALYNIDETPDGEVDTDDVVPNVLALA